MNLYSLEFIVQKLNFEETEIDRSFDVEVQCKDLFLFSITYDKSKSFLKEPVKHTNNGKAILFSCLPSTLVSALSSDIKVSVSESDTSYGMAIIEWVDFQTEAAKLKGNKESVEHTGKYDLIQDGIVIGSVWVQMSVIDYGESIELNINKMGSRLTVPTVRRKTFQMPKDEDEPDSLTTAEGAWAPLFLSQKKQRKSDMDPIMEIYAEMAGISAPEPVHAKLTAEYINKHLCGHKSCPGAIMFQQYGLGPLAESSCLGTISSIKNVKPQGIYGMSQAYGTMDSYGAYGFFVKKKEKKMKAPCESPDCPYTNSAVQESAPNRTISSTKKCQCNNCSKYPKFTKCNSCCNQNCF